MALDLVHKRDLSVAELLSPQVQHAVRAVAAGAESEQLKLQVRHVMERARADNHWLGCDCRSEDGRRPVVVPCRKSHGTYYWQVLGRGQLAHVEGCVFHRPPAQRREDADRWNRPPRRAPEGFFAVLRDQARAGELRVPRPGGGVGARGQRTRARRPALSQLLLMLLERAGLTRVRPNEEQKRVNAIEDLAREIEIAPGRPLSELWFPRAPMWTSTLVHARVRAAARGWPAGHKPQGFLCWAVSEVDAHGVGRVGGNDRVEVRSGVVRPVVGKHPIAPPYLFLGAVGLPQGETGYQCLDAYAQPIVAREWPVPVDSDYERRAFWTLRTTVQILAGTFPNADFELEKPVFDIETPEGPCLPDFLIRARRRGGEELTFVVEVMGFERPDYLRGKEVTHPRMATLGMLCTMQGREFDRSPDGVTGEGRKVTQAIRAVLERRWQG